MFHSRDSPRLLVCDTGLYLEQNDIGFITVAICGGYISKYPGLVPRSMEVAPRERNHTCSGIEYCRSTSSLGQPDGAMGSPGGADSCCKVRWSGGVRSG